MKAIIIDDERLARKELANLLADYPEIEIIGESHNADHAKKNIEALKPDLIFVDIQMPAKTGFDLLEELSFVPQVVFTTAYDEYALKAFEVNAFDYLLDQHRSPSVWARGTDWKWQSEKLNLMESFNRKKNSPGQEQRKNHFPVVKPINSQDPDEKFLLYGKGS